jgi:hypothetical protein
MCTYVIFYEFLHNSPHVDLDVKDSFCVLRKRIYYCLDEFSSNIQYFDFHYGATGSCFYTQRFLL